MWKCKGVNAWMKSMCEWLTTLWKSCWFGGKDHLCCFSLTFTGLWVWQQAILSVGELHFTYIHVSLHIWHFLICRYTFGSSGFHFILLDTLVTTNKLSKSAILREKISPGSGVPSWRGWPPHYPNHSFSNTSTTKDSPESRLVSLNKIQTNNLPHCHRFTAHWQDCLPEDDNKAHEKWIIPMFSSSSLNEWSH